MGLLEILKGLLIETKSIDIKKLPSQGLFYKDDFSIKIKKAEVEDIIDYELNFDKTNILSSIECIKKIVDKNTILPKPYTYLDIKSVDIVFLFIEIVKFTKNADLKIPYINNMGIESIINFNTDNFNYFDMSIHMSNYNKDTKEIIIDGYRFSLPSIGIETSLTQYLSSVSDEESENLKKTSFDFMFFLSGKNHLRFDEIKNLIQIFNSDIDDEEKEKIANIVSKFRGIVGYTLKSEGNTIEIKSKLNLENIWKIN
jgi:hypothetical protein